MRPNLHNITAEYFVNQYFISHRLIVAEHFSLGACFGLFMVSFVVILSPLSLIHAVSGDVLTLFKEPRSGDTKVHRGKVT